MKNTGKTTTLIRFGLLTALILPKYMPLPVINLVCPEDDLVIHLTTCMFHVFFNCNKIWPFLKNTADNAYFEFAFNFWKLKNEIL